MNKKIKIVIILLVLFLLLLIIVKITKKEKTLKERVEGYLLADKYESLDDGYYKKILSNINMEEYFNNKDNNVNSIYKEMFFDTNSYLMNEVLYDYTDNIEYTLNATYNIKNNTIDYLYYISNDNNNYQINGSFNDEFICNTNSEDLNTDICELIKIQLQDTKLDFKTNFKSYKLINEIIDN